MAGTYFITIEPEGAGICSCGHGAEDHQGIPPYTGPEWCEGGWQLLRLDVDGRLAYFPSCTCTEFDGPEKLELRYTDPATAELVLAGYLEELRSGSGGSASVRFEVGETGADVTLYRIPARPDSEGGTDVPNLSATTVT